MRLLPDPCLNTRIRSMNGLLGEGQTAEGGARLGRGGFEGHLTQGLSVSLLGASQPCCSTKLCLRQVQNNGATNELGPMALKPGAEINPHLTDGFLWHLSGAKGEPTSMCPPGAREMVLFLFCSHHPSRLTLGFTTAVHPPLFHSRSCGDEGGVVLPCHILLWNTGSLRPLPRMGLRG